MQPNIINKIKITKIDEQVYKQKGFDHRGCYGCDCDDACCKFGADFDKESYDLVMQFSNEIEALLDHKYKKEDWFENEWSGDTEYLGGNSIRSKTRADGFCMFHKVNARGCVLYELCMKKGLPKRLIPTICRLYPLNWDKGVLMVSDHKEPACNVYAKDNDTRRSLFETQKAEIDDCLDICE